MSQRKRSTMANSSSVCEINTPVANDNSLPESTIHVDSTSSSEPTPSNCCVIDISDDEIFIETPVKRKRTRRQVTDDAELIDLTSASPGGSNELNCSCRSSKAIEITPPLPPPPVGPRCPICLEPFENVEKTSEPRKIVSTKCGHLFCESCLKESLRQTKCCPKCRIKIGPKQFHPIFF